MSIKPIYRYLFIGTLIIVILIFVANILKQKNAAPTTEIPAQSLPLGIINNNQSLSVDGNFYNFSSSKTIKEFALQPITSDELINQLSIMFPATASPTPITYPNGQKKYAWKQGAADIYFFSGKNTVGYHDPTTIDSEETIPESAEENARNFITSHLPIPENISLVLINTIYLQSNDSVGKQVFSHKDANLIQYEYRYALDNKPIFFGNAGEPDIVIQISSQGVKNLSAKIPPTLTALNKQRDIENNPHWIKQQIDAKQYSIIRVDNKQYNEIGPLFEISSLSINSTQLAYLINNDLIFPVYLIRGNAQNKNSSSTTYSVEIIINTPSL